MTKKKNRINLPQSVHKLFPNVTTAYDADKAVEVSVGAKDCKVAKAGNPVECALAKAARRELMADGVIIGLSSSYIIKGKIAVRFATPASVQREIISFDRHSDFSPGEYYLLPKAPSSRLGLPKGTQSGSRKSHRKHHSSARVRILARGRA